MFDFNFPEGKAALSWCRSHAIWTLALALVAASGMAQGDVNLTQGVDSESLDPVAFIPLSEMLAEKTNDIASWYDAQEGQTYVLVGCDNGTVFYRMLPGGRPMHMGKLPTQSVSSLWRDIKVVNDLSLIHISEPTRPY